MGTRIEELLRQVYDDTRFDCRYCLLGVAEVLAGVDSLRAEFLFDTQKLIVLGKTLRTAGSTCLDLAGAQTDDNIGDRGVFGFTGSVRHHDTPTSVA